MVEPPDGSLLGTTVGNYVLVQLLGEGGMGSVFRGIHPEIGAEVAIKVLHATHEGQAEDAKRFLLEAQTVNRVRHKGLVKILDSGYLPGRRPYLVMELLDGLSLSDLVGELSPELACAIAAEALDALQAVHDTGVVHRDLKPANVFVCRDGRVVVLDFGIAKLIRSDAVAATHSSALVGTPEYMAPEQIRSQPLDRRTDIYAMGILLYETVVGRRPFAGTATFDMLVKHIEQPPRPPREWMPTLAPAIDTTILKALAKDPADRYQQASEMAEAARTAGGASVRIEDVAAVASARRAPSRPALTLPRDATARDSAVSDAPAAATLAIRKGSGAVSGSTLPESRPADDRRTLPSKPRAIDAAASSTESSTVSAAPAPAGGLSTRRGWRAVGLLAASAALVAAVAVAVWPSGGGRATGGGDDARIARSVPAASDGSSVAVVGAPSDAPLDAPTDASAIAVVASGSDVPIAGHGVLEVGSAPPGARVLVDRTPRGVTPLSLSLAEGDHTVRIERSGKKLLEQHVTLRAGLKTSVSAPGEGRGQPTVAGPANTNVVPPPPPDAAVPVPLTPPIDAAVAPPADAAVPPGDAGRRYGNPYRP